MAEARTPDIAVVVATHDRIERLKRLFAALERQTLDRERFEVIVVDNGSTDGTAAWLKGANGNGVARFQTVRRESADGPAAGRNEGWRRAAAPFVAFTDDDCEPDPGWLAALLAVQVAEPGAIVQGRTEPIPSERSQIGPFSRTQTVTELNPYFPACNIAYPRELLDRLGGFDQSYPWGGEDTDLGRRALKSGVRIVYADDVHVFHAVNQLGPVGKLKLAMRWTDAMRVFARHAELRRELFLGVFWKRSHALLLFALLGVTLARRFPPALLLTLPYVREVRARCIHEGFSPAFAPYLALYDSVETFATVRGGIRYRVLVA